jgi:hypothetical protein
MSNDHIYRIFYINQGKVYEIYARHISQSGMYAFLEVEDLIFGEKTSVVIDPAEERLKSEFSGVKRTYIPMHAVIRIDEVEKEGNAKIHDAEGSGDQVVGFPGSYIPTGSPPRDK